MTAQTVSAATTRPPFCESPSYSCPRRGMGDTSMAFRYRAQRLLFRKTPRPTWLRILSAWVVPAQTVSAATTRPPFCESPSYSCPRRRMGDTSMAFRYRVQRLLFRKTPRPTWLRILSAWVVPAQTVSAATTRPPFCESPSYSCPRRRMGGYAYGVTVPCPTFAYPQFP